LYGCRLRQRVQQSQLLCVTRRMGSRGCTTAQLILLRHTGRARAASKQLINGDFFGREQPKHTHSSVCALGSRSLPSLKTPDPPLPDAVARGQRQPLASAIQPNTNCLRKVRAGALSPGYAAAVAGRADTVLHTCLTLHSPPVHLQWAHLAQLAKEKWAGTPLHAPSPVHITVVASPSHAA
jgi:hypothetical protein